MDKIIIQGGASLKGSVKTSGSKNAALPLLCASILTNETFTLKNVPDLADIRTMVKLLSHLGIKASSPEKGTWALSGKKLNRFDAPYDLVRTMRASVLVLGPLVARLGKARVSLPGGCAIGARPIDRHLKALEAMGAKIKLEKGYVEATCKKLKGAHIVFEDVTVTGTENIMMAATLAHGTTILENAAREPEVVDLALCLKQMGAKIEGEGTDKITIHGIEARSIASLRGTTYTTMPDRIEAGTFLIGCAMAGGEITVLSCSPDHLSSLLDKLKEAGASLKIKENSITIKAPKKIKPVDITTQPYPGFATDFQAQWMALMTKANGASTIRENIFENRFMHASELIRLGADIKMDGNTAFVRGVDNLIAAPIMATDLRASASLILASLVAKGVTEIHRVYHLDRGYEKMEEKFRKLGAKVKRAKVKY